MIYATIFYNMFHRDGVRTRVELVPVHNINRSATAASKEQRPSLIETRIGLFGWSVVTSGYDIIIIFTFVILCLWYFYLWTLSINKNLVNLISQKFPSHYKLVTTLYQNNLILVSKKFGHCFFEADKKKSCTIIPDCPLDSQVLWYTIFFVHSLHGPRYWF